MDEETRSNINNLDEKNSDDVFVENESVTEPDENTRGINQALAKFGSSIKKVAKKAYGASREEIEQLNDQAHKLKLDFDRKRVRPVFREFLFEQTKPSVIRIFEDDKKMSLEVCQGAIGFIDKIGELLVLNLKRTEIEKINEQNAGGICINFIPAIDESLYYIHPFNEWEYITLDEYFNHLKQARLNELEKIAYDLGAKHFDIRYEEEKKTFASVKGKTKQGGKAPVEVEGVKVGDLKVGDETNSSITINSKKQYESDKNVDFEYHGEPVQPNLVFFKNNTDILNLIEMRMNGGIKEKTYTLKYSSFFGMNLNMAKKIDAAIGVYKYEANASVSSEVEKEKRTSFRYHIVF